MYSSTNLLSPRSSHCKAIAVHSSFCTWHHQYLQLRDTTSVDPASPQTKVSIFSDTSETGPTRRTYTSFKIWQNISFKFAGSFCPDYEFFLGLLIRQSLSKLNRQKFDGEVPTLSDWNRKMESMLWKNDKI